MKIIQEKSFIRLFSYEYYLVDAVTVLIWIPAPCSLSLSLSLLLPLSNCILILLVHISVLLKSIGPSLIDVSLTWFLLRVY